MFCSQVTCRFKEKTGAKYFIRFKAESITLIIKNLKWSLTRGKL
jgi:hypothetical protein